MSTSGTKRPASASSNGRAQKKRARISFQEDEEEEERMEEESEDAGLSIRDLSQVHTQDRGDCEDKSGVRTNKREADVGVIERIEVTDFMCHRKLDVSLSPNVNFILGRNGSGKSAIMTAIVVALGGKATATHRASSLKQFIRTGAKSAEVIITMRNRGLDSYKSADYGRKVIVHRVIRDDGTTQYKIKGADGRVVSTKREDLVLILDHMNIQVDNPVSLLNQDTSRNFLHSNNPAHKYKLFMKATRLEQISRDYVRAREDQGIMTESIKRNKAMSEELKHQTKVLEEKVEMFHRLKEMEGKVSRLEMELQWVLVKEMEAGIPPLEEQVQKERERVQRNGKRITINELNVQELNTSLQAVGKDLEKIVNEAQEIHKRRVEKASEKRQIERQMKEIQARQRGLKTSIGEQTREKRALQQKLEDLMKMSQQDTAGERERRRREIEKVEGMLCQLRGELDEVFARRRSTDEAMKVIEDRRRQQDARRGQLNHDMSDGARKVSQLQSSRSDQLLTFGPWMPALVKAVQAAHSQFRKPPKGPVGALFKLHDYRWSVAIEAIIGRETLSSFVVDNPYDRSTILNIVSGVLRGQRGSGALVSRYTGRPYDVSRNRPHTDHPTVLDMMDIADLEIVNLLVDLCHIDTVLLIERRLDAERVIEVERPRGATMAYTVGGDQILMERFYAHKKRPLGIIQESVDRAIQEEQGRLSELGEQRREMDRTARELREEAGANKGVQMKARKELSSKQNEIHQVEMKLKELRSAEEEEESQEDIATYESEIQECAGRISEKMEQKANEDGQMSELGSKLEACDVSLCSVETEKEDVASRMEEIKAQHSEYERERLKADGVAQHYRGRVREIQTHIANLEKKLSEVKQRAEEAAAAASEVCERVETRRSRKSLETETNRLKRRIEQEEPQMAEKEAVEREYTDKVEQYQKTMKVVREHSMALKELSRSLDMRVSQYEKFQDNISQRACIYFKHYLQQRDYEGGLTFNHDKEVLKMEVNVDRCSELSQATKNTKSLSGGERSFTTICFIMSLWEAIESPFRCLDEFDVFMDMMNRRISMRVLMECALDQRDKQFIFLTPQDMSQMGVQMGPQIKILKLNPPERDQTTLD